MNNGDGHGHPNHTPPAARRTLTFEELLQRGDDDYASTRELRDLVASHYAESNRRFDAIDESLKNLAGSFQTLANWIRGK